MQILKSISSFPEDGGDVVLTLGNFDGVHLGHQKLIRQVVDSARRMGGKSVVITFFPHPAIVLHKDDHLKLLSNFSEMERFIAGLGVDFLVRVQFTHRFSNLSAREFLESEVRRWIRLKALVVGRNHRFGRGRDGDPELLRDYCFENCIELHVVDPVMLDDAVISSTAIRRCIRDGDLEKASRMLGRPYMVSGVVSRGAGRGAMLGFPTANLVLENRALPPCGVYATRSSVRYERAPSMTYVGKTPTFSGNCLQVETHIFGLQQMLYGETVYVEFLEKIRDEKRFEDAGELVEAVRRDARKALQIYQKHYPLDNRQGGA